MHCVVRHITHAPYHHSPISRTRCARSGIASSSCSSIALGIALAGATAPVLDAWEDAAPGRPTLFQRVIVRIERDNGVPVAAWTYAVPRLPDGSRELMAGIWPLSVPMVAE